MAITREEVLKLARLARIALSDAEIDPLREKLNQVLDYARQLDRLDTNAVAPTVHIFETATPLREDIVHPFMDKEALLKNAPDRLGDYLRVSRILEG
jgi:aspartyl-tRNA(Asn)/glutamyl-tRNA(Gln) amidotransferase subunit C